MSEELEVGAHVAWQSSGLRKSGVILAVVPAGKKPEEVGYPKLGVGSQVRDHTSYIVKGGERRDVNQNQLFWPRTSLLNPTSVLTKEEIGWLNLNIGKVRPLIAMMKAGKLPRFD